jgi:hypothetical protein
MKGGKTPETAKSVEELPVGETLETGWWKLDPGSRLGAVTTWENTFPLDCLDRPTLDDEPLFRVDPVICPGWRPEMATIRSAIELGLYSPTKPVARSRECACGIFRGDCTYHRD